MGASRPWSLGVFRYRLLRLHLSTDCTSMLNLPIGDLAMSSELAIAFATCLLAMKHKQCVIKINNGRIIYRKIVILTHILSNCCIFVNQMNVNMRIAIKVLCVVFFLPLIVSCGNKVQYKTLSSFIPMAEKHPDSALTILNKINQAKLSNKELAIYSLVYTIAQDKSGLDVDNDSLLRIAYNWYNAKPDDSLYAICEYYMGKYYALNDSSEKALKCFSNSMKSAKQQCDSITLSLALQRSSAIIRTYDPNLAIKYAKECVSLYNNAKGATNVNKVYSILNLAECLSYKNGTLNVCISLAKKAIHISINEKDSSAIADSYQDLCEFYSLENYSDSSILAAKLAYRYRNKYDVPAILSYAQALYMTDSLKQASILLNTIKADDYQQYGDYIYSLKRLIAMNEQKYDEANTFADSSEIYLTRKNNTNLAAKDRYYKLLINKETARLIAQEKSKRITILSIAAFVIAIVVVIFIIFLSKQKRQELEEKNKQSQNLLRTEITHKNTQLTTIRNFLEHKIDIMGKLEKIKTSSKRNVDFKKEDWDEMEIFLNNTDDEFVERIKNQYPALTSKDVHFIMLVRLKVPISVIATIYHIEGKSVRQKLFLIKSKIGLKNSKISAKEFIENF